MKKLLLMLLSMMVLTACAFAELPKREINVISRGEGSGTRGAFIELFGIEQKNEEGVKVDYTTDYADITNSTAVMMTSAAGKGTRIALVFPEAGEAG